MTCVNEACIQSEARAGGATSRMGALVGHLWRRVPVILRAIIIGSLLSLLGTGSWAALAGINLKTTPAIPWSVPAMAACLWLFWRYLNGWGWPRSSADVRRLNLRANRLSPSVWRWTLWAGGLAIAAMTAMGEVAERFVRTTPYRGLPDLSTVPALTIVLMILMLSAVAGIVEEAAFRGYMQVPIERRHGPVAGIATVAICFTLAHLWSYAMGPATAHSDC